MFLGRFMLKSNPDRPSILNSYSVTRYQRDFPTGPFWIALILSIVSAPDGLVDRRHAVYRLCGRLLFRCYLTGANYGAKLVPYGFIDMNSDLSQMRID